MAQAREVEVKFRRDLGLLDITMIGLGPTIGTTIFLLVGPGFAITGPSLVLAFGLNFVVTMFTAMAYMELGSAFPETGGGYLWIRRSMRDPWGFLGGWMSWFGHCIVASFYIYGFGFGIVLALKTILGTPFLVLYGLDEGALTKLFAVLAAGVFIGLNYRGTKLTGRSETAVTIALVVVVSAFIIAGLVYLTHTGVPSASCLLLQPSPAGPIGNNNAIAEIAAQVMPYGTQIIVFGVTLGAIAALNSLIFSSSRVAFAMGRDGGLPRILGKLHAGSALRTSRLPSRASSSCSSR